MFCSYECFIRMFAMSTNCQTNIKQMKLTGDQIQVLERINVKLVRGDIGEIKKKTKLCRYTVSKCLSLNSEYFNQDIVDIAVARISAREQITKKSLTKISSN